MREKADKKSNWDEVVARDRAIVERICTDEQFAYYFIYNSCEGLIRMIMKNVRGGPKDFEEFANELYLHLRKPGADGRMWHNLRLFDYRTTLFDWIKTVAIRLFVNRRRNRVHIPPELVESGIVIDAGSMLEKASERKYVKYCYVESLGVDEICEKLELSKQNFANFRDNVNRHIAAIVKKRFPEYYSLMVECDAAPAENPDSSVEDIDNRSYIETMMLGMSNPRYREVINELYLNDVEPEVLAEKWNTPVANIYNIRKRAIEQLRDVVILSGEINGLEKYIRQISDDRIRSLSNSLFIKRESYEDIITNYSLSPKEFRQLKKEALTELKRLKYGKNDDTVK